MPWQMPLPESFLGQLAGGALGAYNLSQQAQQQKAQIAMQKAQQQDIASNIAARSAATQIDQQRLGMEQQQFAATQKQDRMKAVQSGFNPDTGTPLNYGYTDQQRNAGFSDPDLQKRAAFMATYAARAAAAGATGPAQDYLKQAYDTGTMAVKAQEETLKFQLGASKLLNDAASRAHMNADEALRSAGLNLQAQRLGWEVSHGNLTAERAQQQFDLDAAKFGLSKQEFAATQQARQQALAERNPQYQVDAAVWKANAIAAQKAIAQNGVYGNFNSYDEWLQQHPEPLPSQYGIRTPGAGGGGGGGSAKPTVIRQTINGRAVWRYSNTPNTAA